VPTTCVGVDTHATGNRTEAGLIDVRDRHAGGLLMASTSWSLELPDGRHMVEVEYGIWSGNTTVRVDGRVADKSNRSLQMGFNRGVDVPVPISQHRGIISVRPRNPRSIISTEYTFGLSIDGVPAPGSEPVVPIQASRTGPRLIETMALASAGGGVIGLSQGGENPTAFLFLVAPAACSVVTRQARLSTKTMGLISVAIILLGIVVVAAIGAVVPA